MFSFVSKILFCLLLIFSLAGFSLVSAADNNQTAAIEDSILPDSDLIGALCANSKWRAADFMAWVGAYNDFRNSFKEKIFPTGDKEILPNLQEVQRNTSTQLAAICTSTDYATAMGNFKNLVAAEKSAQAKLRDIDAFLQKYFQEQVDALKTKVSATDKANLKSFAAQGRAKKEGDLQAMANQMAGAAEQSLKSDLSGKEFPSADEAQRYVFAAVQERQDAINNQLAGMASQAKTVLQSQAESKVLTFLGKDGTAGFALIVNSVKQVRSDIANLYQNKTKANDKLKNQALEARKNLVLALLDKESADFRARGAAGNQAVVEQLTKVRQEFLNKAQAAVAGGDLDGLNEAVKQAQSSWQEILLTVPEAALSGKNLERICSSTPVFVAATRPQLQGLIQKIQNLNKAGAEKISTCRAKPTRKGCAAFNAVFERLALLQSDAQNFSAALTSLESQCKNQSSRGDTLKTIDNVKQSGLKLQSDWADWKKKWPQYQKAI